jgi:hypothetical protein
MSNKTNISELPSTEGIGKDDLLIVQSSKNTSAIKFEDFILGPENVSFYQTILDNKARADTLSVAGLSSVGTVSELSASNPGLDGNKTIVYVKERTSDAGTDTGGFFMFDYGESLADNGGTIIDPTSASVTGRWKRINYDYIDPRWFGASTALDDNRPYIQAAIDYSNSSNVYKPVKIPNGTFNTQGISAGTGVIITGSGTSILQQVKGGQSTLLQVEGDNTIIENLELIGTYNNGFQQNNIYLRGCDDVTVRNCRVQSASGNNIIAINTQRCKITDNLIYQAGGNNIHIYEDGVGTYTTVRASERNIISNNNIYTAGGADILETGSTGVTPNYNLIAGNVCDTTEDLYSTGVNSVTGLNISRDVIEEVEASVSVAKYSSGWANSHGVPVADAATLTFTHNLDTTDLVIKVYVAPGSDGLYPYELTLYTNAPSDESISSGAIITDITETTITVQLGRLGYKYTNTSGDFANVSINGHNANAVHDYFVPFTNKYIKLVAIG